MKRKIGALVAVAIVLIAGVAARPVVRQELAWRQAAGTDTAEAYQRYLEAWPDGRHTRAAAERKDDRHFALAEQASDRGPLDAYLALYPGGRHVAEARDRLEDVIWQGVQRENSIAALEGYLGRADAKYLEQARVDLDRLVFESARSADTISALDDYLRRFKDRGQYLGEARLLREDVRWRAARADNRVTSYEAYIKEYPDGRYLNAARQAIEDINWALAGQTNTIAAFRGFQAKFTGSPRIPEADDRIAALAADPAPWEAADRLATRKGYQDFLAAYPGHQQEATARERLGDIDGRDLFDLLSAGRVTATAKGNGMETVIITIQSKVNHEIKVTLAAGAYFVAANASYPNMVARSNESITVRGNSSVELFVDAASATHFRGTPYQQNSFTMQRTPPSDDLARLTQVLARSNPGYTAAQAAIWMVTNNTNWAAMGSLVVSYGSTPSLINSRAISYSDAVRAMQLLDDTGINIRTKAIWTDRQLLLNNISDSALKTWLQAKVAGNPV